MSGNLALILTILTLVTGIIVALNKFLWHEPTEDQGAKPGLRATLVEYSRSFFPVLLFVLVIRSFVFEPFRIPSGSMMPTLLTGDFIFVKKYTYGLRLPVTETKILNTGEPKRGDVAVFRLPSDPSINYIKRVVGLPGDTITIEHHRLLINDKPVPLESSPQQTVDDPLYIEQLGDRTHDILIEYPGNTAGDGTYVIPAGEYFMMGDNRDDSRDSRFINAIPERYFVGEAVRIWMHMDGLEWPAWSRIGKKIQ